MDGDIRAAGARPGPDFPAAMPEPPGVPGFRFSTLGLPPAEQFEAWRASQGDWFETWPLARNAPSGFEAERDVWRFGPIALARTWGDGVHSRRDARRARRDQLDHWLVTAVRSGGMRGEGYDGGFACGPGQVSLYGLHLPSESVRNRCDWLMLLVPRDALPEAAPAMDSLLDRHLADGLGRMLYAHLDTLARLLPGMPAAQAPAAAEATLGLLRAVVTGSADHMAAARPQLRAAVRTRVLGLIREQLGSARLTPERLCRPAGLSRTQLYRVFEADGGVARTILRERLRAMARALADPQERRTIAQIAEACGMPDASAAGRAFRREFGATPGEFREEALSLGRASPRREAPEAAPVTLSEMLRRLRA